MKSWFRWRLVSAHLCTVALSVSHNAWWRVPRDAFRYGALPYLTAHSAAMLVVALPLTMMQLALGHLSQEDVLGIWRAVPFFKGVGYVKLLATFMMATYTTCYVALSITFLLYSFGNSIPFLECTDLIVTEGSIENVFNASECLNTSLMSPVGAAPEKFAAVALVQVALCLMLPFILYNLLKNMKRVFYVFGPLVVVLAIVVWAAIGSRNNLGLLISSGVDWSVLLLPSVWVSAISQAILSSQIGGGFLMAISDTVYTTRYVQWISLELIGTNILTSWLSTTFWYSISSELQKDTSILAVLVEIYKLAAKEEVHIAWCYLLLILVVISGFLSLICLMYPVLERCRRVWEVRWVAGGAALAAAVALASLAALAARLPALSALDTIATPPLLILSTTMEILAFLFVYGWKALVGDVEFLTGRRLLRVWVWGWFAAGGALLLAGAWWAATSLPTPGWTSAAITLAATVSLALIIFVWFAVNAVARQDNYDVISKIFSSFKASRQWGPRDPITHYYWLARRKEISQGVAGPSSGWRLGQLAAGASFFNLVSTVETISSNYTLPVDKRRALSDDLFWTKRRRETLIGESCLPETQRRSRSLDWPISFEYPLKLEIPRETNQAYKYPNKDTDLDEITHYYSDKSSST